MAFESETGNGMWARVRRRGPVWASAHVSLYLWDKLFDFVLYPFAIIQYGLLWGTAVMMSASLLICVGLIYLYDRLSGTRFRDLLGFESLKEAAAAVGKSRLASRLRMADSRLSQLLARSGLFLYLTVWFDPMTCTIFMRPADHYRMSPRYWSIFALSVLISNGYWALLVYFGVESVQALFGMIA
ncbi:MAG: hypothetical protein K0B16_17365 [Burkholderiaceae bacterium]|nr:hypothetical protein [Burkholderiaceae bacterium]